MNPRAAQDRRRRGGAFWLPFAIFAALGILWSLASPIFSVPDENAHAVKAIAQLRGQVIGYTLPGVKHIVVDLPEGFEYSPQVLCFATRSAVTADCASELGAAGGQDWFNTWVGAYNPIYYELVGWPSLFLDGNAAVFAMRMASALLCAALLAWAFRAASSGGRARWMPLGVAFAAAPMTMYLAGSVNPNGLEFAAAVAVWAGTLRLLESFAEASADSNATARLGRVELWAGVAIASILLANARATGPAWLVVVVLLCFIVVGWRAVKALFTTATSYWWLAAIAVGGLFSIGWTMSGGSLSSQAEASDAPLVNGTFLQGFAHTLRYTPDYIQQAIGYFGWFDTPLPVWVYWFAIAAVAVPLVLAFTATSRRSVLVLSLVVLAGLLVPALVQGYGVHQTGIIWQGRYALFLYLGVGVVAGWLLDRDADRIGFLAPRVVVVSGGLLALYGVLAFWLVLVRYGIGLAPLAGMLTPHWQPPLGWFALTAVYAVVSASGVWLLAARTRRAQEALDAAG